MSTETTGFLGDVLVLPDQIRVGARIGAEASGEHRLMLAILEDAVATLQLNRLAKQPRRREAYEDARAWMASSGEDWLYSFENICETLAIDAGSLRERLLVADGQRRRSRTRTKVRIVPLASLSQPDHPASSTTDRAVAGAVAA